MPFSPEQRAELQALLAEMQQSESGQAEPAGDATASAQPIPTDPSDLFAPIPSAVVAAGANVPALNNDLLLNALEGLTYIVKNSYHVDQIVGYGEQALGANMPKANRILYAIAAWCKTYKKENGVP